MDACVRVRARVCVHMRVCSHLFSLLFLYILIRSLNFIHFDVFHFSRRFSNIVKIEL